MNSFSRSIFGLLSMMCMMSEGLFAMSLPDILSTHNLRTLDTRSNYNFHSMYVEVGSEKFILFEQVENINFDRINVKLFNLSAHNDLNSQPMEIEGFTKQPNYLTLVGHEYEGPILWVYFSFADGYDEAAQIMKGRLTRQGKLIDLVALNLEQELIGGSWPRYHRLTESTSAISLRAPKCCGLALMKSSDGVSYVRDNSFQQSGTMPVISSFESGNLIYSYQRSFPTDKKTSKGKTKYVQKSRFKIAQQNSWSPEYLVSEKTFEIHDAFPFKRLDGRVDLYYVNDYGREPNQLSVWRRCVDELGNLGKEEQITDERIGNVAKPYTYRNSRGEIFFLFIEQGEGLNTGSIQQVTTLTKDAACSL
ncbi:hypothetical protein EXT46_12895 [Pseudoalteromonas sp. CO325X]|uniref:hypothetical protein n=1 Tax=Pseudoalteromonas sp. CO325X TaxID=1777262 RepID=UPI001022E026|nr:hypothetical protein [Pseudoalteromonas sp. CO325X]RZF80191.1 hypothetical protein EXT46_12895 [Pseudoalteromonas sp. CO325X]